MPTEITVQQYQPSEIISILRNHLATGQVNQRIVCLRGIYFKGAYINQYYHTATDRLVDETSSDELSLAMPLNLRDDLENGNVVTVHGSLDRSITNKCLIQIVLKVTAVEKLKELAMSEDEVKRTELRRIKSEKGFKNVDSILESLLYQDKRPKVALIYAESSITNEDFEKGVQAARTHIDFTEYRESFARTKAFCQKLKQLDAIGFDVIAIIRGGGATADLSGFDTLALAENVANFPLPVITGIGHERDESVIDMVANTKVKTPTAAAALLIDNLANVSTAIDNLSTRLVAMIAQRLQAEELRIRRLAERIPTLFATMKANSTARLDATMMRITNLAIARMTAESHRIQMLQQRAEALDPTLLLKRGYTMTMHGGHILKDVAKLKDGDTIETITATGRVTSKVKFLANFVACDNNN